MGFFYFLVFFVFNWKPNDPIVAAERFGDEQFTVIYKIEFVHENKSTRISSSVGEKN